MNEAREIRLEPSWKSRLECEFDMPYMQDLRKFLLERKQSGAVIYPPGGQIFNAMNSTPFDQVKVVILGQDPYHGKDQAHGLCFSVPQGIPKPPSLVNIFKELQADLGIPIPEHGTLDKWADQGVLLINATLTVRDSQAGSHQKHGWETFTNRVIEVVSQEKNGVVFLLWGRFAQAKESLIDNSKHLILKSAHPSPLSAYNGFFGCKHFSLTNDYLEKQGNPGIDWAL